MSPRHNVLVSRLSRVLGADTSVAPPPELERAAVAVLLVDRDGASHVPLTVRASTLHRQPGQISLPGGRIDTGDPSTVAAAQRETREELGLASDAWDVLGVLDVAVCASGFAITPVVGELRKTEYVPNADEVDRVLEVPLAVFGDPGRAVQIAEREFMGHRYTVRAYRHAGERIWGVTARILECVWQSAAS